MILLHRVIERLQEESMILKSQVTPSPLASPPPHRCQIEEEKSDMQLVSSRVLDERMLRRLLQEERSRVQKLKISLSNSKQSQLVAESQVHIPHTTTALPWCSTPIGHPTPASRYASPPTHLLPCYLSSSLHPCPPCGLLQ
jgi:hypothetical protein